MISTFASLTLPQVAHLDSTQTLMLTVNNRYARRVLGSLSASLDVDRQVMALPEIMPLAAWLRQASDQLSFEPDAELAAHTLDSFGARGLWQQVIEHVEGGQALLDASQAARLAIDADTLLSEWNLTVDPAETTIDYDRFALWREKYREQLGQLDAEDANLAFERVCRCLVEGTLALPFDTLVLVGFNELSPRLERVLEALAKQGLTIYTLQMEHERAQAVQRVLADDLDAEWRLAAEWAAEQLQADPKGRYAIVAPQLEGEVAFVHRVLREALRTPNRDAPLPYNIAVARPLSEWPVVRAAIAWLRLLAELVHRKTCEPALAGAALLAGHCVGVDDEQAGRAQIDARWRKFATVRVSAPVWMQCLADETPQLAQAWAGCFDAALADSAATTLDRWVWRFRAWLEQLGFPGPVPLDSHAYQAVEAYDRMLLRLEQQAIVFGELGFGAAVAMMNSLALQTLFQPQRNPDSRLDVQGFLEAEGGRWDGVWVLGLSDDVLPAPARPNPFIPLAALRRANAPRATPERELQWAHTLYDALLSCAPSVWVSSARREGERELRPSPCIAALETQERALHDVRPEPVRLERVVDDRGPALADGVRTRGGIGVIDVQARNPLWAFVKYRLGATRMEGYAELSDQNARGIFLHRCMELICLVITGQEDLARQRAQGNFTALCEQAIDKAAQECLAEYSPALRDLEMQRAQEVLENWFIFELARPPFRVSGIEKTLTWSYQSLSLTLRLDRIDELDDGKLAVIDYKTGAGNLDPKSDWMRTRPVGLQLPFYAAVLSGADARVSALVFARLHASKAEARGLAEDGYAFGRLATLSDWDGFAPDWDALLVRWRDIVNTLAAEYVSGVATNSSLRPDDLQYCDVLPFLRLTEENNHVVS